MGRPATKSPKYESSKKCNNTKFEWVQLWNEGLPLIVWNLHLEGVRSMSNQWMTPGAYFHSLVQLEAHKTWSCATPWIQRKEKTFDQIQLSDECVEDLVHQDAWLQFIGQGNENKNKK
jgi:hypothetical protein